MIGTIELKQFLSYKISQNINYITVDYISLKMIIRNSRLHVHKTFFFQEAWYSLGHAEREGFFKGSLSSSLLCSMNECYLKIVLCSLQMVSRTMNHPRLCHWAAGRVHRGARKQML